MASPPAESPPAKNSESKDTQQSPPSPTQNTSPPPEQSNSSPPSPPSSPSPDPSPPQSTPPASPPPSQQQSPPPTNQSPSSPSPDHPSSPPPSTNNPPSSSPPHSDTPSSPSPSTPTNNQPQTPSNPQSPPSNTPSSPVNTFLPPSTTQTPSQTSTTPSIPSTTPSTIPNTPTLVNSNQNPNQINNPQTTLLAPPQALVQTTPTSPGVPVGTLRQTHNTPSSSTSSSSLQGSSGSGSGVIQTSSNSVNPLLIAGLTVSGFVLVALIVVCIICSRKRKKEHYYPKNEQFYNGSPGQWQSPKVPNDHIVKVSASPVGGPGGWSPAQMTGNTTTSGEYSSGTVGQNQSPVPRSPMGASPLGQSLGGFSKSQFSYEELASATGGFTEANLLGQGGFGYVHKGVLPDGKIVAVKSLKTGSGQGEREFQAEVEIISRIHHKHLVSLVGYCISDGQRMLVYEFVANKTLEFHLHGKGQPVMDWKTRLRLALGSAKGLAYLHEDCHPRIIHRDIKAANILIDLNFEAMVADFGLAKLTSDNNTHVSTRVMGTFGYLAPEYASSGKLTDKSDVFSFGVMLLELITGRKPVDSTQMEDSLVDWARPLLAKAMQDGNHDAIADPRLEGDFDHEEMAHMISCAAASIRHSSRRRPKMSQIVRSLEGDLALDDLNEGVKMGQSGLRPAGSGGSNSTGGYDTEAYNADMMKFRQMVLTSGEQGSTTDPGLNLQSSDEKSKS